MNTTMDSLVIDIQSTSTDASSGIDNLIERLTNLKNILQDVAKTSSGLSNLKNIGSNIKSSNVSKKIDRVKQEDSMSGVKNIQTTPLFDEMKGQIMKVDTATSMLQSKLNTLNVDLGGAKIKSTFSDINTTITKYVTKGGSVVTITDKIKNGFKKVNVSVKTVSPSIETFSNKLDKVSKTMEMMQLKIIAIVASITMLIRKIGSLVTMASSENEALNLFMVTMGEYAEDGIKWIENFSNALYLDPVQVMQYMGSFNSLIKGLGVGADNAYLMSQNLTQLVYDLSSFKNISIESAYEKLLSGISGELEPLILVAIICEYYRKCSEPTNVGCGKEIYR